MGFGGVRRGAVADGWGLGGRRGPARTGGVLAVGAWGRGTGWVCAVLPSMVSPIGVYLMRTYADISVPRELIDAARIDGAGEVRIFSGWRCR